MNVHYDSEVQIGPVWDSSRIRVETNDSDLYTMIIAALLDVEELWLQGHKSWDPRALV